MAEISSAANCLTPSLRGISIMGRLFLLATLKGQCFMSSCTVLSVKLRPIRRLASKTVVVGLMVAWFLAASPTRRSSPSHAT